MVVLVVVVVVAMHASITRRVHGCLFLNHWDISVSNNKLKILIGNAVRTTHHRPDTHTQTGTHTDNREAAAAAAASSSSPSSSCCVVGHGWLARSPGDAAGRAVRRQEDPQLRQAPKLLQVLPTRGTTRPLTDRPHRQAGRPRLREGW